MGQARFMFYPWFLYSLFVGDQTKTSALPNFEWHWNINRWTMLRMLFSLLCVKYINFSFGFIEALDSKRIINTLKTLKKGITSTIECADAVASTFATWQIRSCLLRKFISPEVVSDETQSSSPPNFEPRNLIALFAKSCWRQCLYFCLKYIFFWFYGSIGSEGNNKYAKKGIKSAMECKWKKSQLNLILIKTFKNESCC